MTPQQFHLAYLSMDDVMRFGIAVNSSFRSQHACQERGAWMQVLKGLQGLQQPSLIARLAEDLTSHVLDSLWMDEASNRDLSNGILPAMAELLCSWLRLLAEVHAAPVGSAQALPDPEQLPQVGYVQVSRQIVILAQV